MGGQARAAAQPRARRRGAFLSAHSTPPLLPAAEPEKTLYLHREALGSVGLVTDNQGGEVERTYFDPFGEKVDALGEVDSPMLGDVKLGFTGHRHDDELGLIDMKGRVYDPAQKRFLTPDPHVPDPLSGQSYNRYSYVTNNPLRYTDPTGFQPAAGDLKTQGSGSQPGGGAAAPTPAPTLPIVLTAPWTIVIARLTDVDQPPPPPPPPDPSDAKRRRELGLEQWLRDLWSSRAGRMFRGAAGQLWKSSPIGSAATQITHDLGLLKTAGKQVDEGEYALATSTVLEIPEEVATTAARLPLAPIYAALSIPASVQVMADPEADPEDRGAAAVSAAQGVVTVATAAAGVVKSARGGMARSATSAQKEAALQRARGADGIERCTYCDTPLDRRSGLPNSVEIDHRTPFSKGGKTVDTNLDAACRTCNRSKGNKGLGTEWIPPKDR